MADLAGLTESIETGNRAAAAQLAGAALAEGIAPQQILDAMIRAMDLVGGRFQGGEIFVPEMLISARAMKEATAVIAPALASAGVRPEHTAVIGTIQGDLHDIGKNLVGMMWTGANFEVVDLGVNVSPEAFAAAVRDHNAAVVGISALLTTTMVGMQAAVEAIHAVDSSVKVIVGGAPVTPEFASQIGADGYASDAGAAAAAARAAIAIA
jgi:5-methyltetrahydrofolate--homocysteine methyltransferase